MSIQAMVWAMKQEIVTSPTQRHVLLCLANYAGEDGVGAFPSVARLARDTGLSERAVQQNIAKLAEAGVIVAGNQALVAARIDRTDRRPNVWNIAMDATGRRGTQRGEPAAPRFVNWVNLVQSGVNLTTERGEPAAPDPSINHQVTVKEQRGAVAPVLPDWLPADAWQDWHTYRNTRKGWTAKARELSLRKLESLWAQGYDPQAVIEQSIENGWAGLFPIRHDAARAGPAAAPVGKQMQGIKALEDLKNAARNQMAVGGSRGGAAEAVLPLSGPDARR